MSLLVVFELTVSVSVCSLCLNMFQALLTFEFPCACSRPYMVYPMDILYDVMLPALSNFHTIHLK